MTRRSRLKLTLMIAGILSLHACTLPYVATELDRLGAIAIGKAAESNDPEDNTGEAAVESERYDDTVVIRLEGAPDGVIQAGEAVTLTASASLESTNEAIDMPPVSWRINGRAPEGNATPGGESQHTLTLQTYTDESGMVYTITAYTGIEDTDISVSRSIRVCACQE